MKQIYVQESGVDAAAITTEESIRPNIDDSFDLVTYYGPRLNARTKQSFGVKSIGGTTSYGQGFAVYGNYFVRLNMNNPQYIYQINPSTNILSQVASFNLSIGHANSAQFAPVLESGQSFPYLYVAYLEKKCVVVSISSQYSASIVQTITVTATSVPNDSNVQIGDDGHIWCVYLDSNNHYRIIKFRKVAVSEGNISLTDSDILDDWTSLGTYPYASYVWQGMTVRNGQLWLSYGITGDGQERGIVVFDTKSHTTITELDLGLYNVEWEDLDFWNDSVLIMSSVGGYLYQLKF